MAERRRDRDSEEPRNQMTSAEVHSLSIAAAHSLLDGILQTRLRIDPTQALSFVASIHTLAEAEARETGATAYREGAQRLDRLNPNWPRRADGMPHKVEAVGLYFKAASAGDELSADTLDRMLTVERESGMRFFRIRGDERARPVSPKLLEVVKSCAYAGIPADAWIKKYKVDDRSATKLKMYYLSYHTMGVVEGKLDEKDNLRVRHDYRDQVTEHFLADIEMPDDLAVDIATRVWAEHQDPEIKERMFVRVQDIYGDSTATYEMFASFVNLSRKMLENPEDISLEQAQWLSDITEYYKDEFLDDGVNPVEVYSLVFNVQVDLATYFGATPDEIIDMLDTQTTDLMHEESAYEIRDDALIDRAKVYASRGEFGAANSLLTQVATEAKRHDGIREVLEIATTDADADALAPDALTLMVDPIAGEIFEERKIFIAGDPERIRTLALDRIGKRKIDADAPAFLRTCYAWMEAYDRDKALELARAIEEKLVGVHAVHTDVSYYAQKRFEGGDEAALAVLLANVERSFSQFHKLEAYADLAFLTAPDASEDTTVALSITRPRVVVYVDDEGKLYEELQIVVEEGEEPQIGMSFDQSIAGQEDEHDGPQGWPKGRGKSK